MHTPRSKGPSSRPEGGAGSLPARRDTRNLLLDAALAVFDEQGRAGFTVHAVVAESGISLGSLYHHFGSMEGLSAALYARSMARLLDAIGASLDGQRSARATVATIVRSYLAFTATSRAEATFVHTAPAFTVLSDHAEAIAADKAPRLERIASAIRVHVKAGAIVALPDALLEMLIIGPVAEVARRWLAGAPGIDLDEASRLLPERVWRGVRA